MRRYGSHMSTRSPRCPSIPRATGCRSTRRASRSYDRRRRGARRARRSRWPPPRSARGGAPTRGRRFLEACDGEALEQHSEPRVRGRPRHRDYPFAMRLALHPGAQKRAAASCAGRCRLAAGSARRDRRPERWSGTRGGRTSCATRLQRTTERARSLPHHPAPRATSHGGVISRMVACSVRRSIGIPLMTRQYCRGRPTPIPGDADFLLFHRAIRRGLRDLHRLSRLSAAHNDCPSSHRERA